MGLERVERLLGKRLHGVLAVDRVVLDVDLDVLEDLLLVFTHHRHRRTSVEPHALDVGHFGKACVADFAQKFLRIVPDNVK